MGILDGILGVELTEIADLPTYEIPPEGVFRFLVKEVTEKTVTLSKTQEECPALDFKYEVIEAIELTDPSQMELVKPGQQFNETYFFRADKSSLEMTKSALKATFGEVAKAMGETNLMGCIGKLQGMEILGVLKHRKDKQDKEKFYAQVRDARLT